MAADPGGTTGICFATDENNNDKMTVATRYQVGGEHHLTLWTMIGAWSPDRIISERFDFRQSKKKIVLDSREYIGVMKLWCQANRREYVQQTVMSGKASSDHVFWNMEKLQAVGLWLPGQSHANDATAHMLYYITFTMKQHHYLQQLQRNEGF